MSYKIITALTFGHAGDARTIDFAAALAAAHDARALVFPYVPDPALDLISFGMLLGTHLPDDAAEAILASQARLRHDLEALCLRACKDADLVFGPGSGLPRMELFRPSGRPEVALAHSLALTDLVVISRESLKASGAARDAFGQVLLQHRTPVLLVRGDPESLGWPAMIAWDGSAEAGRAVRQALPLIAMASGTTAVQCRHGLDRQAVNPAFDPLIDYLRAHGVGEARTETLDEAPEGQVLTETAKRLGSGVLIAGAYGHTRMRETIFGGATRAMLEAMTGPSLLMAH